jgi:hypothetical protein
MVTAGLDRSFFSSLEVDTFQHSQLRRQFFDAFFLCLYPLKEDGIWCSRSRGSSMD